MFTLMNKQVNKSELTIIVARKKNDNSKSRVQL